MATESPICSTTRATSQLGTQETTKRWTHRTYVDLNSLLAIRVADDAVFGRIMRRVPVDVLILVLELAREPLDKDLLLLR